MEDYGTVAMEGPIANKGYYCTLPSQENVGIVESADRRNLIVDQIESKMLDRPLRNKIRNDELDADSEYEKD